MSCGGTSIPYLEDGTSGVGWDPEFGGPESCIHKCLSSALCTAFEWRQSDGSCFFQSGSTPANSARAGYQCYSAITAPTPDYIPVQSLVGMHCGAGDTVFSLTGASQSTGMISSVSVAECATMCKADAACAYFTHYPADNSCIGCDSVPSIAIPADQHANVYRAQKHPITEENCSNECLHTAGCIMYQYNGVNRCNLMSRDSQIFRDDLSGSSSNWTCGTIKQFEGPGCDGTGNRECYLMSSCEHDAVETSSCKSVEEEAATACHERCVMKAPIPAGAPRLKCGAAACAYYYTDISGMDVADLTEASKFPDAPDETRSLTGGSFATQSAYGTNFGAMIEGYVRAPVTAAYTFFTESDDASEVWVATEPATQSSLVKVVELESCCIEVTGTVQVSWTAGKTYYIKGLLKEGGGGTTFWWECNLSVVPSTCQSQ